MTKSIICNIVADKEVYDMIKTDKKPVQIHYMPKYSTKFQLISPYPVIVSPNTEFVFIDGKAKFFPLSDNDFDELLSMYFHVSLEDCLYISLVFFTPRSMARLAPATYISPKISFTRLQRLIKHQYGVNVPKEKLTWNGGPKSIEDYVACVQSLINEAKIDSK